MNQHNEHNTTDGVNNLTSAEQTPSNVQMSRRNFLTKVGVATLPVVASVQSGSAWGCISLDCTPGAINLSGTSSAVSSAVGHSQTTKYLAPKWPTPEEIMKICVVDFDKYLLDIKKPLKYKINGTSKTVTGSKTIGQVFGSGGCGHLPISEKIFTYTTDRYGGYTPTGGVLNLKYSTLEGLFIAAFLGSLWENHSAYTKAFPPQPGSLKCYPPTALLVNAYKTACAKGGQAKEEMKAIFSFYMSRDTNRTIS